MRDKPARIVLDETGVECNGLIGSWWGGGGCDRHLLGVKGRREEDRMRGARTERKR